MPHFSLCKSSATVSRSFFGGIGFSWNASTGTRSESEPKDIPVTLHLEGEAGKAGKIELVGTKSINLKQEDQAKGSFFVVLPRSYVNSRKMAIRIGLYQGDKRITTLKTNFTGPFKRY